MAQNPTPSSYNYRPLANGHIRLLRIYKQGIQSIYELCDVELASNPDYLALSYSWDDQLRDRPLIVNGKPLQITRNMETFLRYLPWCGTAQHCWIDGVCINQEDNTEKGVQVSLMQKIYFQAAKCVVWLGESNPLIDLVLTLVPVFVENLNAHEGLLNLSVQPFSTWPMESMLSPFEKGLSMLFSKNWFQRVWTYQEAVLPDIVEVMCGEHCIDFDSIASIATGLFSSFHAASVNSVASSVDPTTSLALEGKRRVVAVRAARSQKFAETKAYDFIDLLFSSWEWCCSNPSDKLYGLLGIADRTLQDEIVVDYRKTSVEVYLEFASCWIPRDFHLMILHLASSSERQIELPSWCPNLNSPSAASSFEPYVIEAKYRAGICTGKVADHSISCHSTLIHVAGFCIDEIVEVMPCPWERQNHETTESKSLGIAELLKWDTACLRLSQRVYGLRSDVPDAHWRTLIANKHVDGKLFSGSGPETYHMARILLSQLCTTEDLLSDTEAQMAARKLTDKQSTAVREYCEAFGYASHGRAFLSTRGGRIGLGPLDTKPGDLVCIFHNAYTPFILRPEKINLPGVNKRFVGEAYVDGLMYGEAFQDGNEFKEEVWVIE